MGNRMQRKDYRFDKLLAGDYEAITEAKKKREKSVETEDQQMSMLSILEDKPSDEGEFLTSYVADYRRIQEHGK